MIRANKVKIMTKAAAFEQREERKALYVGRYFLSDYVLYGMLKSALSLTIAFGLCAGMWVIYHAESLMTEKSVSDLFEMGKDMVLLYVVALVVFLLISLVAYCVRYQNAQKKLKGYRGTLRRLAKSYQDEMPVKEKTL